MPPKTKKSRYNILLSDEARKVLEKISRIESQSMCRVIEFAIFHLNKNYEAQS